MYPLKLTPDLKERVWGGDKLEPILGMPRTNRPIGEAWLIYEDLIIENGEHAGKTLAQLTRAFPDEMLGNKRSQDNDEPRFPLLAKFLDPKEFLSIQLHPNDEYARAKENQPNGKCEFWYAMHVEPDASLIHGVRHALTREELIASALDGSIRQTLNYIHLKTGDVVINLPGTIHALGAGILIYELQQSSDLTYRLYDWGRTGRELHLNKSADVADLEPMDTHTIQPLVIRVSSSTRTFLCACDFFAAELIDTTTSFTHNTSGESPHLVTVIDGGGRLGSKCGDVKIKTGDSVVVPASVGAYSLTAESTMKAIVGYVPDLKKDVIAPLRQARYSDVDIVQLGGDKKRSHLVKAL
jgi:mannose-6-phosphate isomerase